MTRTIQTKKLLLVLLFILCVNNIMAVIHTFPLTTASNYTFHCYCNYNPNIKKYIKLISKINNAKYVYYDMSKANPRSSCNPSTLYKEFKGIDCARQIEKLVNQNFNEYSTITKNGCFFCLTKDDLKIIQGLYENWFALYLARNEESFVSNALDGSIYHWETPF